jgi:hypothetical protein
MENKVQEKLSTIIVLSLLAFVMTSTVCKAQEWSRKGKGEFLSPV